MSLLSLSDFSLFHYTSKPGSILRLNHCHYCCSPLTGPPQQQHSKERTWCQRERTQEFLHFLLLPFLVLTHLLPACIIARPPHCNSSLWRYYTCVNDCLYVVVRILKLKNWTAQRNVPIPGSSWNNTINFNLIYIKERVSLDWSLLTLLTVAIETTSIQAIEIPLEVGCIYLFPRYTFSSLIVLLSLLHH